MPAVNQPVMVGPTGSQVSTTNVVLGQQGLISQPGVLGQQPGMPPMGPPPAVPGQPGVPTVAAGQPGVPGQQPGMPPPGPPPGIESAKFQQFTGAANIDTFFVRLKGEDLPILAAQITSQQLTEIQTRFGGDPKFQQFIQTGQIPEVGLVGTPTATVSGSPGAALVAS